MVVLSVVVLGVVVLGVGSGFGFELFLADSDDEGGGFVERVDEEGGAEEEDGGGEDDRDKEPVWVKVVLGCKLTPMRSAIRVDRLGTHDHKQPHGVDSHPDYLRPPSQNNKHYQKDVHPAKANQPPLAPVDRMEKPIHHLGKRSRLHKIIRPLSHRPDLF